MEREEKHCHGEAAECVDERRKEHDWSFHVPKNIEDAIDERPC